jgi:hypothetical protein
MKREHESTDLKAQKMMKGRMEPSTIPTVVRAMPLLVHVIKHSAIVPKMTSPQGK